ncbi:hypothetical protein BDV34DRAFT_229556 [Aspergillus parasiticus]|uniref:FAD-binding domain-containing protein n=1 Tax=Aspergillus parasiticus TaxID=5067 RepID=A0A5N6D8D4_ASPPA|nr:hypothetical protein BDV34DRAFT_229556 [Aspergillus parasiticus]
MTSLSTPNASQTLKLNLEREQDAKADPVVVIGAGPVGLFTALLLTQKGIKIILYESESGINQSPRAVAYFPAVLEEFSKAGILEAVIAAGEKNQDGCDWRDKDGKIITGIDPPPENPHYAVMLSQPGFCEVVMDALLKTCNADVHFHHKFQDLEQRDGFVEYCVENKASNHRVQGKCQYLVGADGGRSMVRRSLGLELEGYTWESTLFIAVNFEYGLRELGWKAANFIVDPEDWGIIVKRGKGKSWRMATGIRVADATLHRTNTLDEATIDVVRKRLCHLLPGDTSRIEYGAIAPYVVHQRCASSFVQGNVLLAGDAAHLNNPVGGLGLTTGLLDAAHLAGSLGQVLTEGASHSGLNHTLRQDEESSRAEDVQKRSEFFESISNQRDLATILQVGLPDFALTSTSNTKFDTYHEVTWFISVTKPEGWATEKFTHEYKTIHAGMTRRGKEHGSPLQGYIQLSNTNQTMRGGVRPDWDYVTCLTFPNMFLIHAGFQDPGYRATAGAHIFCRLDQQGCLAKQVARLSRSEGNKSDTGTITRALLFHERNNAIDDDSQDWFHSRADRMISTIDDDENLVEYVLWQDMTPKNLDNFFNDTQLSGGSWHNYKAVEAFDFADEAAATSFLDRRSDWITENDTRRITVVIGDRDDILRG